MEIDGDRIWMTTEELDDFYECQRLNAIRLNALLIELCLLLLDEQAEQHKAKA